MIRLKKLTLRGKHLACVLATMLSTPVIVGSAVSSATTTPPTPQTAIPAYFWDTAAWEQIASAQRKPAFVVANPDSGPGTARDSVAAASFQQVSTAGISVIGYVHTSYGNRPLAAVLADVERYRTFYGITRIFLDETPYQCDTIPYYTSITTTVRQNGGTVVLNPGMNPLACWAGVAEGIVNFEGSAETYATWQPASWTASPSSTAFWHIIYAADPANGVPLLATAASRNASSIFVTDDLMPNPFDRLPGAQLWSQLTAVNGSDSQSTSTTTTTAAGSNPTTTTIVGSGSTTTVVGSSPTTTTASTTTTSTTSTTTASTTSTTTASTTSTTTTSTSTSTTTTTAPPPAGSLFTGVSPARVLDTRSGNGAAVGKLVGGQTVVLQVAGRGGVPVSGVSSVMLNVTVTEPGGDGYVTVFPCDGVLPGASNLNYVVGQTIPNLVAVKTDPLGRVCLYTTKPTHLIADIASYAAA